MNRFLKSKRVLFLFLILTGITFGITLITTFVDYKAAIEVKKASLIDDVNREYELIQTLYNNGFSKDSILHIVRTAHQSLESIGKSSEFVIGVNNGNSINFLFRKSLYRKLQGNEVYAKSGLATPMRMAIENVYGAIKDKDYRGVEVYAGLNHFKPFGWGIVSKIDVEEVNKPFISTLFYSLIFAMIFTFIGAILFVKITNPMLYEIIKNEENLSITLHSIGDGVIATDEYGLVTTLNPVAEHLCGWSMEDAKGKPLTDIFNIVKADTRMAVVNPVRLVIESGNTIGLANHTILISKDGSEYQIADSAAPIKDTKGKISGVILVFSDITDKYKAEDKIRESEKFLKQTQRIANLGTYTMNIATGIWDSSEVLNEIFGINKDYDKSIAGWVNIIHSEWQQIMNAYFINDVIANKNKFDKEYKIIRQNDKTERWLHGLGDLIFNEKNEPILMIGTIQDITERKKAEEELVRLKEDFQSYFNMNSIGICITSKDKGWIAVNDSLCQMLGYTKEELSELTWSEMTHPDDILSDIDLFNQVISGEINEYSLDKRFYHKNGEIVCTTLNVVCNRNIDGSVNYLLASLIDITERSKAEMLINQQNHQLEAQYEEYMMLNEILRTTNYELKLSKEKAEESDNLKTAFLQNMSHEIRTPLNGILGFSNLLQEDNLKNEEIKEYTRVISQSGYRLMEIINNVLDISKIETGQIEISNITFSLNSMIADLYSFFSPFTLEKKIKLNYSTSLENSNCQITTDDTKLNQILTNLINNALKFTSEGDIDFGYEVLDEEIRFFVKDTGMGISPEFHNKIFNRFTQIDLKTTRGFEGAGLGLAICKGLVEKLGGKIWVESELSKGTSFFFTLPNNASRQEVSNNQKADLKINFEKRIKILIVEDDLTSCAYLSKVLKENHFVLIQVQNGLKAVESVKNISDIDLILMDIRMPVMDGIEATKQIKAIRPDLPIIAQTAYAFREERERILSIGCNDYLSKPIEKNKLLNLIKKYVG